MKTELQAPIQYWLSVGDDRVHMNEHIGSHVKLTFEGEIYCISCGKRTNKSFAQGFCYPCFMESPDNSECIIRPELCEAHTGGGRDPEWEKKHHLREHVVYLAVSSAVKVGVTGGHGFQTRWIDQGASAAIRFALTPYRQAAGLIEVALKEHLTDRTHWQKMLKNDVLHDLDLVAKKKEIANLLPTDLVQYVTDNDQVTNLEFPVTEYPTKVKSINLDKTPIAEGTLMGIKGQYLIFDGGRVINIRKYNGYLMTLEF
jgi:hypothetical protein